MTEEVKHGEKATQCYLAYVVCDVTHILKVLGDETHNPQQQNLTRNSRTNKTTLPQGVITKLNLIYLRCLFQATALYVRSPGRMIAYK